MKKTILILSLFISISIFSQNGYESWDKTYTLSNAEKIIQAEVDYAKEVEKENPQGRYYIAMNKFRFLAEFTGRERAITEETLSSMKRVFKMKTGSAKILNNLVSKEFEFNIGSSKIWMPMQNPLIEAFKNEVKVNSKVLLYALFTNEHKFKGGIINTFLISEFLTDWE